MDAEMMLVDMDALLVQLLRPLLPGVEVVAATDATDMNVYPIVIITPGFSTAIVDAPEGYGYTFTTTITLVHTTRRAAFELADLVHRALFHLSETSAAIAGIGRIGQVADLFPPRRTGSSRVGNTNATEFLAVYSIEALTE